MKREMDCYRGLKLANMLFFGGMGLMLLSLVLGFSGEHLVVMKILAAIGFAGVVAGLVCGWSFVKCPDCGSSLMPGGRLPTTLPNYCPHCGKEL